MATSFSVRLAESGVFVSASHESDGAIYVPGLPVASLPFWRFSVEGAAGETREHVLVEAHAASVPLETCRRIASTLRPLLNGAVLSLERGSADGLAEMVSEAHPAEAAAAAAELRRCAGWTGDVLRVVTRQRNFDVRVSRRGDAAVAEVAEVSE